VIKETDRSIQSIPAAPNWTPLLTAGLILLICIAYYQATQTENLLLKIANSQRESATLRTKLANSDDELRKSLTRFHGELTGLRDELASAREQADRSLAKAQEATTYADTVAGKLDKRRREQEKQQQQLSAELTKVRKSTVETSTLLNGISDEVGHVKSRLESVHADATQNSAELRIARGDMGSINRRVATNLEEIERLRGLGDRNIYEFTLTKAGEPQRVGGIEMKLNKTDEKHNRFNVEIVADDKRIEKRDKTINEPVQFFVRSKAEQAYELVVNEIGKNTVKGYLSAPKVTIARNQGSAGLE
jgi:chromosome segregation ATPase